MVAQVVKHPPTVEERQVQSLGWKDPLETKDRSASWGTKDSTRASPDATVSCAWFALHSCGRSREAQQDQSCVALSSMEAETPKNMAIHLGQ